MHVRNFSAWNQQGCQQDDRKAVFDSFFDECGVNLSWGFDFMEIMKFFDIMKNFCGGNLNMRAEDGIL